MISRQFLVTAVIMALIGMVMSTLFRLQLGWPGHKFWLVEFLLGDKWGKDGIIDPNMYLALVTIHGTIMVFFLLTGGLSGTFSNLLIPYQVGARDMASGFLNMLSFWFFAASSLIMCRLAMTAAHRFSPTSIWTSHPVRSLRWLAPAARAKARCLTLSRASTIRPQAAFPLTARIYAP